MAKDATVSRAQADDKKQSRAKNFHRDLRQFFKSRPRYSPVRRSQVMKVAMTGFSVIALFLLGGFGIFYGLSSVSAPAYAAVLCAVAWAALCVWIWVATQESDDR